jgi:hypothetical protein
MGPSATRERWQRRSGSIQVPANRTTYPTSRCRDRDTYRTANTVLSNKNEGPPVVRSRAPRCRCCGRIPHKSYLFEQPADTIAYRTLQQEQSRNQPPPHTVLSRKNIPYRLTNVCSLRQFPDATMKVSPTKDLQITEFLHCLAFRKDIPYPATSFTVPCDKPYRTLRQALPYSPARNTVLTGKKYRTLPQNIAYPATSGAR